MYIEIAQKCLSRMNIIKKLTSFQFCWLVKQIVIRFIKEYFSESYSFGCYFHASINVKYTN